MQRKTVDGRDGDPCRRTAVHGRRGSRSGDRERLSECLMDLGEDTALTY